MKLFPKIPFDRVNWTTSLFLIITAFISITAVPLYLWHYGIDAFQIALFFIFYIATGLSITLGYHRLFSHNTFKAKWPVKLFTLIFGAAAFENSALDWSEDHRKHHRFVDQEEDPYDISKGFFWAHIGWLLFKIKPRPPHRYVKDLQKDSLVMWQHRWCHGIAFIVSFGLPTLLGYWYNGGNGALGAFLIGGVLRVVAVQHSTFFINSLCHTLGSRPYSINCSARDSWVVAFLTFGEGYHNYHHEFEYDYRNGIKPWQFDPTKWSIWVLSKLGLAKDLKSVSKERILKAEMEVAKQKIEENIDLIEKLLLQAPNSNAHTSCKFLKEAYENLTQHCQEIQQTIVSRTELSLLIYKEWREELRLTFVHLECVHSSV